MKPAPRGAAVSISLSQENASSVYRRLSEEHGQSGVTCWRQREGARWEVLFFSAIISHFPDGLQKASPLTPNKGTLQLVIEGNNAQEVGSSLKRINVLRLAPWFSFTKRPVVRKTNDFLNRPLRRMGTINWVKPENVLGHWFSYCALRSKRLLRGSVLGQYVTQTQGRGIHYLMTDIFIK